MQRFSFTFALAVATFVFLACCPHESDGQVLSCVATSVFDFWNGNQHCDCSYKYPPVEAVPETEHQIDLQWIAITHEYAVDNCPNAPYGGALVDRRTNTLVSISCNQNANPDIDFNTPMTGHGETAVMFNASRNVLAGTYNATTKRWTSNPNWKYMTLYASLESCPMCTASAMWRGVGAYVFGARASALREKRCNSQPYFSSHEIVDMWRKTGFIHRGPMVELEDWILNDFPNRCPQ